MVYLSLDTPFFQSEVRPYFNETADNNKTSYQIHNIQGRQILNGYLDTHHNIVDMSHVAPGIYLIKIENNNKVVKVIRNQSYL